MSVALDRLIDRELARLWGPADCACATCRKALWVGEVPPHRLASRVDAGGAIMPRWRGWSARTFDEHV